MRSVDALTDGLIDYAGLFPPAELDMGTAVRNYAEYRNGPDAKKLGRFILPATRLDEFSQASNGLLPRSPAHAPWQLSVLLGSPADTEINAVLKFNCEHWTGSERGHCVIDTIEARAETQADVVRIRAAVPDFYRLFLEVPLTGVEVILGSIRTAGCSAKIRTGGVEVSAFPAASSVVDFITSCRERRVSFKATAGLHHAVYGRYALTYNELSGSAPMFGFLNVFAAACFLFFGSDSTTISNILHESDPGAFRFTDEAMYWRENAVSVEVIAQARSEFAISFGSCSFTEPVAELAALL